MTRKAKSIGLVVVPVLMLAAGAMAQRGGGFGGGGFGGGGFGGGGRGRGCMGTSEAPLPTFPPAGEFHFIRMEYTDLPSHHQRVWVFLPAPRKVTAGGLWIGPMPIFISRKE